MCGVYIWGEDFPAYNVVNVDLFECFQEDINAFESKGSIFIVGDWNARVGNGSKADYFICDRVVNDLDNCDFIPDSPLKRCSVDNICNTQGDKLLDLCKSMSFRIANGRLGLEHLVGGFTLLSHQGASVIDYLIAKEHDFSEISYFRIADFNEWSDHAPITFGLISNNVRRITHFTDSTYYKWDDA